MISDQAQSQIDECLDFMAIQDCPFSEHERDFLTDISYQKELNEYKSKQLSMIWESSHDRN